MNTVVCVLKSGVFKPWVQKDYTVEYGPQHVQWLRDQFAAHIVGPHRFVCLTDMEIPGVETLPLQDDLPGWWSKLEVFREFQQATYVDLDTVVLGDVGQILFAAAHKFTMAAHMTKRHGVNSSVMSWNGDYRWIYDKFIAHKAKYMAEFTINSRWGDQDFIKEALVDAKLSPIEKFSHRWPEFVLSYRHDILNRGAPMRVGGRKRVQLKPGHWQQAPHLVCFHGSPKPYEAQDRHHWIPKLCVA